MKDITLCKLIFVIQKIQQIFQQYRPNIIMRLAAESHVDRSINNPREFIQTNIIGIYTLLEVAHHYWNQLKDDDKKIFRLHHIFTDGFCGVLNSSPELFAETTPYSPSSLYSFSKASNDHLVRASHHTYRLPALQHLILIVQITMDHNTIQKS